MTFSRFAAAQWLLVLVLFVAALYALGPILAPFLVAAILAYVCAPLVERLCRWRWPRTLAVLSVMAGMVLLVVVFLLILLPLLEREFSLLLVRMPDWLETAKLRLLPWWQQQFGTELQWDAVALKQMAQSHWQSADGSATQVLSWLGARGAALATLLTNALLIPLAMFYLLRDWNQLLVRIDALVPRHWHARITQIAVEIDDILAEFLRGQLSVMLLMSMFYAVALWLAGLEFALPIGLLAGLLVFIPYLGMLLGVLLATLAAAMQFGTLSGMLVIWGIFAVGQLLEGMLITPWLVGDRIGLHPLAVIFALMAFAQLFGFVGLLLALPMAAIVLVGLRHLRDAYLASDLYGKS
ncbi:MAG: AI-2E family transporter [Gallionella sp.]|jgi:predicted PurR-regulated permease PerM|nr:AI-2E family transporter [Gallionella sp.]